MNHILRSIEVCFGLFKPHFKCLGINWLFGDKTQFDLSGIHIFEVLEVLRVAGAIVLDIWHNVILYIM